MRNLKQTELQRLKNRGKKGRGLRIRPENEKKENHEKQCLATLKRLMRGELKRNLRLEKVVVSNSLGWPWRLKKIEEQEWRMIAFLKSWQLCLSFKLDVLTT